MSTVGSVGNPLKDGVGAAAAAILEWCAGQGVGVLVQEDIAGIVGRGSTAVPTARLADEASLIFALGGDGTLLVAVRAVARAGRETPIFGVNVGSLGFLTQVTGDELPQVLALHRADGFPARSRMMISARVKGRGEESVALNDIVIRHGAASRMLSLEARVDGEPVTRYSADGLILSTPTGSTAYALSAGGPVVMPSVEAIVATPICPHSLSVRSCVIPPSAVVEIEVLSGDDQTLVSADGDRVLSVRTGDTVIVKKAARAAKLVEIGRHSYYEILRRKMRWAGRVIGR